MLDPDFLCDQAAVARRLAEGCPWPDLRKQLVEISAEFERRADELSRRPTLSDSN